MDMDREMRQGDDTNTTTQVDGSQNQSMNGSQGDESQEQPFQEEDTNLIRNKRKLTSNEAIGARQVTYANTSPRGVRGEKLRIYANKCCQWGQKTPGGPSNPSCYSFDENISRQDLAKMIIVHEYPLVLVEHHGFRKFVQGLQPLFTVPCRNIVKSDVFKIYDFKKQKTMRFIYVPCPHTADVLANVLYESLCDWNIDRKISTVTVDNCTTNDAMIRDLLDKLRDSVSYWTLTPKRVEKFEEAARHLDIPSLRTLALDCKTRWNSTYLMLEVAIIYKDVFRRLKQRDARYKSVPTERDWHLASNICKKLKLFYNVTLMFSGTKYPTMNTFFTSICDIRYELNKWKHEEDEVIRDMAEQMILKFDKYWSDIHGFMGVAAVLDPRMKLKIMKFSFPKLYHSKQRAEEEFTKLKKFVSALFIEYDQAGKENVRNHVNCVGSTSHIDESDGGFFLGYSKFIEEEYDETLDITSEVPEELDHYLKERVCNPNMKLDILAWWKINGLKYPTLQTIARDILAIPISTVASESCFSTSVNEIQENCSKEFEAYDQTIEYNTDDSDEYSDAKIMVVAIKTRFGGNEATKKTQKTLLKQQYENFSASSTESLDSIFNRLQKILSRLAILGVVINQEDLNSNFLRSLPPEWNTHVVVWMNKAEIEAMSIDDWYNNFKIIKQSVKKSVGASSDAQNLAFMTAPSTSSTNDVNTAKPAYEVSTVSPNVNTASPKVSMVENPNGSNLLQQGLEQIHEDDLEAMDLKWQLFLLSMRAKRYFQRTGKKIFINANDTVGYDKSKIECFNCHKMGHFTRECRAPRNKEGQFRNQDNTRKQGNNKDTSSNAMLAIDGVGFDWSDMAEEHV
ncbi:zinc finger BED domain-containing protein RICESLEEPER 2-like protein [Tanacetum coccineum]